MHAHVETSQKPTSAIANIGPETVEGNLKLWDVEYILNQQALPVQGDDGSTLPKDWSIRIVTHPNTEVANRLVGDEGSAIG
jgi:hypothetical protein